jgi:hypothetical protein
MVRTVIKELSVKLFKQKAKEFYPVYIQGIVTHIKAQHNLENNKWYLEIWYTTEDGRFLSQTIELSKEILLDVDISNKNAEDWAYAVTPVHPFFQNVGRLKQSKEECIYNILGESVS